MRLFRSNCVQTNKGLYVKDLRVLNCDLNSTLIVDNSIISFAFQLDNGIPIVPFYEDKEDVILPKIYDYLMSLKDLPDVRVKNKETFSLTQLYSLNISRFLKYYYDDYDENDSSDSPLFTGSPIDSSPDADSPQRRKSMFAVSSPVRQEIKKIPQEKKIKKSIEHQLGEYQISLNKYLDS